MLLGDDMDDTRLYKYAIEATEKADQYTEGICKEGSVILKNGKPISLDHIIDGLNNYSMLMYAFHKSIEEDKIH